jgi:hypothetical protein
MTSTTTGSTSDPSPDSPIRVVVTPSQSSYFAGEPFSVTITFTNTRTPESLPPRSQAQSHTHKRGAHSISSAPLARPPTSPGTPRTLTPPVPLRANVNGGKMVITRKGFIGKGSLPPQLLPKGADELPDVLEQSRKRLLAKARPLSVCVSSQDVEPGPKTESAAYVSAYEITPCKRPLPSSYIPLLTYRFRTISIHPPSHTDTDTNPTTIWPLSNPPTQPSTRPKTFRGARRPAPAAPRSPIPTILSISIERVHICVLALLGPDSREHAARLFSPRL